MENQLANVRIRPCRKKKTDYLYNIRRGFIVKRVFILNSFTLVIIVFCFSPSARRGGVVVTIWLERVAKTIPLIARIIFVRVLTVEII